MVIAVRNEMLFHATAVEILIYREAVIQMKLWGKRNEEIKRIGKANRESVK